MVKLASILEEVSALESSLEKVAASKNKGSSLASFLDKIAEEAEQSSESEEKKDEEKSESCEEEKENKEGSMKLSDKDIQKIAQAVLKIAVLDTAETQGNVITGTNSVDGAATNAARAEDQIIPLSSVESAAESNPQRHNVSPTGDLIEGEAPNTEDMAKALKEGSLVAYTAKEAAVLEKFASIGYNHVVDVYSDQLVQEKIAEAVIAEKAKDAPQKIAKSILRKNSEKTAAATDPRVAKLAQIKRTNPELFNALQTLAKNGLI